MRRGDLSIVASSLQHAMKSLRFRWDETQDVWNDSVRRQFDEQYIVPLEPQVSTTLKAVNRLSQIFARASEECS
ncbi:MAG TPA: hypothetical protein VIK18_04250 [Pirellulales bacterium]